MIKGHQSDVIKIYENIRNEEQRSLNIRREEMKIKLPEVLKLEKEIGKLSIKLSLSIMNNAEKSESIVKDLKEQIINLRVRKSELLVSEKYQANYLDMNYRCSKCQDTGFIGSEKCVCYKKYLIQLLYDRSDLKALLKTNNFDYFKFEKFSQHKSDNQTESPRKRMEQNVKKAQDFIRDFGSTDENLLFLGTSGTGKTFLSHCVAKELLDTGIFVVYRTSDELIQNLKTIRFSGDNNLEQLLTNCDLLIIDDLGSEQISDFSKTELFNLLNKKLLKKKKMLISSNCGIEILLRMYSERLSSRLFGNFTTCKFIGEDIRVNSNYK